MTNEVTGDPTQVLLCALREISQDHTKMTNELTEPRPSIRISPGKADLGILFLPLWQAPPHPSASSPGDEYEGVR